MPYIIPRSTKFINLSAPPSTHFVTEKCRERGTSNHPNPFSTKILCRKHASLSENRRIYACKRKMKETRNSSMHFKTCSKARSNKSLRTLLQRGIYCHHPLNFREIPFQLVLYPPTRIPRLRSSTQSCSLLHSLHYFVNG